MRKMGEGGRRARLFHLENTTGFCGPHDEFKKLPYQFLIM
jgi:hypothetical protein